MRSLARARFLNGSNHAKSSLPLVVAHLVQRRSRFSGLQQQRFTHWRTRNPTISSQRSSIVSKLSLLARRSSTLHICAPKDASSSKSKDWWETTSLILFFTIITIGPPFASAYWALEEWSQLKVDLQTLLSSPNTNSLKEGPAVSSKGPVYDILKPREFRVLVLEPRTEG